MSKEQLLTSLALGDLLLLTASECNVPEKDRIEIEEYLIQKLEAYKDYEIDSVVEDEIPSGEPLSLFGVLEDKQIKGVQNYFFNATSKDKLQSGLSDIFQKILSYGGPLAALLSFGAAMKGIKINFNQTETKETFKENGAVDTRTTTKKPFEITIDQWDILKGWIDPKGGSKK